MASAGPLCDTEAVASHGPTRRPPPEERRVQIEIMTFRLRPETSEADFVLADRRVQVEFAYHQPGMVRRTTARNPDGAWVVIDLWASAADAADYVDGWNRDPAPRAFMALIDENSVETRSYQTLD
jgi:hypothetical protein